MVWLFPFAVSTDHQWTCAPSNLKTESADASACKSTVCMERLLHVCMPWQNASMHNKKLLHIFQLIGHSGLLMLSTTCPAAETLWGIS